VKNTSLEPTTSQAVDPQGVMQSVTDRTLELIRVAQGVMVDTADAVEITSVCGAGSQTPCHSTMVDWAGSLSGLAVRSASDRLEVGVDLLDFSQSLEPPERLPMAS